MRELVRENRMVYRCCVAMISRGGMRFLSGIRSHGSSQGTRRFVRDESRGTSTRGEEHEQGECRGSARVFRVCRYGRKQQASDMVAKHLRCDLFEGFHNLPFLL